MERGRLLEDEAVRSYCFEKECEVETVGFITTDDGMIGCSPDRVIAGWKRGLEIKCPSPQVHVGYMMRRTVDKDYWPQVQGQMLVGGFEGVDIQSYYPGLPSVIIPVERDEKYIALLEDALRDFVSLLLTAREFLTKEYGPFRRAEKPAEPEDGIPGLGITDDDLDALMREKFPKEQA